jgi:hypothetical protein
MAKVREAIFTPTPNGGDIQATMELGSQELTTRWPVSPGDDQLRSLLDRLLIRIEQVSFSSSADGAEIQATLRLGDQVYVSRWPIAGEDQQLRPALDRLLDEISRRCVQNLMAELQRDADAAQSSDSPVLSEDQYSAVPGQQRPSRPSASA